MGNRIKKNIAHKITFDRYMVSFYDDLGLVVRTEFAETKVDAQRLISKEGRGYRTEIDDLTFLDSDKGYGRLAALSRRMKDSPAAVCCLNTWEVYSSDSSAAGATGDVRYHITKACNDKKPTELGLYWRKLSDVENERIED